MTSGPELVALLYRTDWRQLSLSATVTTRGDRAVYLQWRDRIDGARQVRAGTARLARPSPAAEQRNDLSESQYRVLLAPGGRYWVDLIAETHPGPDPDPDLDEDDEDEDYEPDTTRASDGESRWAIGRAGTVRRPAGGPDCAFRGLITPRWVLACYDLEITGLADVAGRPAHRVVATPRPVITGDTADYHFLDRVDLLVDAELGIIVRSEQVVGGQPLQVAELHDLRVDPAPDPALFAPPPGLAADKEIDEIELRGWRWQAAAIAAGAAGSAMGFAARHAPRRKPQRTPGDTDPDMPAGPGLTAAEVSRAQPPGDELINLLHRTGLPAPALTARLHQWTDPAAFARLAQAANSALPQPLTGILGPDALWAALGDVAGAGATVYSTADLRFAVPGRFRLDYRTGDWHTSCRAVATDGARTRRIYHDHVTVGPARPLRLGLITVAELADPAWLLDGWRLSSDGPARIDGRDGQHVRAEPAGGRWTPMPYSSVEAVVDAELGVLLRLTHYFRGSAVACVELRELAPLASGAELAGFGADAAPGLPESDSSRLPLPDWNLPAPVKVAGSAAVLAVGGAIAGAAALTGWLEKHRVRRGPGQ